MRRLPALLTCVAVMAFLAGCAHRGRPAESARWANARQLVLVTTPGWNAPEGTLRTYERDDDGWHEVASATPVTVGRSGAAWGLGLHDSPHDGPRKREGDGRSPAGVFAIGTAFGYADTASTALPYTPMDAGDYCIDESDSALYNRIVDAREVGAAAVAGSTEPMRRDLHADGDQRYRLGFVIEHNAAAKPGAGSCIFAHLWKSPGDATAGCTAMAPPAMQRLLGWLDPARHPVFVLLPADEYAHRAPAWSLPVPGR